MINAQEVKTLTKGYWDAKENEAIAKANKCLAEMERAICDKAKNGEHIATFQHGAFVYDTLSAEKHVEKTLTEAGFFITVKGDILTVIW